MHSCWMLLKNQFEKNSTNVHGAPSSGHHGHGVGYNGHVYRHVGGTSCVDQHIFNSEIKKLYLNVEIFIFGVEGLVRLKKIYFL